MARRSERPDPFKSPQKANCKGGTAFRKTSFKQSKARTRKKLSRTSACYPSLLVCLYLPFKIYIQIHVDVRYIYVYTRPQGLLLERCRERRLFGAGGLCRLRLGGVLRRRAGDGRHTKVPRVHDLVSEGDQALPVNWSPFCGCPCNKSTIWDRC